MYPSTYVTSITCPSYDQTGIKMSSKWESIDADQASGSEEEELSVTHVLHLNEIYLSKISGSIDQHM